MIGVDARYNKGSLQLTGQYIIAELSNTDQYNGFTGKDVGSKLTGYYYEIGYNLMDGVWGHLMSILKWTRVLLKLNM